MASKDKWASLKEIIKLLLMMGGMSNESNKQIAPHTRAHTYSQQRKRACSPTTELFFAFLSKAYSMFADLQTLCQHVA